MKLTIANPARFIACAVATTACFLFGGAFVGLACMVGVAVGSIKVN